MQDQKNLPTLIEDLITLKNCIKGKKKDIIIIKYFIIIVKLSFIGIFTYVFEVIFPLVHFNETLTIHHGLMLTHFIPELGMLNGDSKL